MKLSTRARYALRMMLDVWRTSNGGKPVRLEEVANRTGISRRYLDQLVLPLKNAGLLRGVKGPGGGYVLAHSAETITAGDIIQAVEEPLAPVYCVNGDSEQTCHRLDGCVTRLLWERLGHSIIGLLDSVTVQDLCVQAQQLKSRADLRDEITAEA